MEASEMLAIRAIQENALFESIRKRSDSDTAARIVYGEDGSAKDEKNPVWVKSTMKRLEDTFDKNLLKEIRGDCQCGYGMEEKLAFVKELVSTASNLQEFASSDRAAAAGLFYEDGSLYLKFLFCPCPMLAEVDRLETNTWCQCTTGYSKVLFEQAFQCSVEVELLKSIKMGDEICLMKIIPQDSRWV